MMVAVALMLLFPPFYTCFGADGFHFLFAPPFRASVDIRLLLTEWTGVVVFGGLALLLLKDR